jgi:Zn-dependent metalloprotease
MNATSMTSTQPPTPGSARVPMVVTYDAQDRFDWGHVARIGDEPPTHDRIVDAAHGHSQIVLDFMREVLGRNSIDDAGMAVQNVVRDPDFVGNAAWDPDGAGSFRYGEEIAGEMGPTALALDIVAHEMFHGVNDHTAALKYQGQSGALSESFSDVMAEAVEQWHRAPETFGSLLGVHAAGWTVAEDVLLDPAKPFARDMRQPSNPLGHVPQPEHMQGYVRTSRDSGGVHTNSGIPNRAAFEAARLIGTEKVAKIWYDTVAGKRLGRTATFEDAARGTIAAAEALYPGEEHVSAAVRHGWAAVGL